MFPPSGLVQSTCVRMADVGMRPCASAETLITLLQLVVNHSDLWRAEPSVSDTGDYNSSNLAGKSSTAKGERSPGTGTPHESSDKAGMHAQGSTSSTPRLLAHTSASWSVLQVRTLPPDSISHLLPNCHIPYFMLFRT